ncbi:MAG: hypothetical protein Q4C75_07005 [Bergeyella zoohelcum]|nr:hypothetical protein [Bergeyella zoohelcum]
MKRTFAIIMTTLLLMSSFQQGLVVLHFKINQTEIEKRLCINKENIKLGCHGKCQLTKRLADTSGNNTAFINLYRSLDFVPLHSTINIVSNPITQSKILPNLSIPMDYRSPILDILHPPPNSSPLKTKHLA